MKTQRLTERQKAAVAAWSFAHAALWKNEVFTVREIEHHKFLIEQQFDTDVSVERNLVRFCIRVMLVKRLVEQSSGYSLPRPSIWLNKNFECGYAITKSWYEQLIQKRIAIAGYGQAYFTLARGFAKYSECPSKEMYNTYRERLLHLKAFDFLQVFYNAIVFFNYQY